MQASTCSQHMFTDQQWITKNSQWCKFFIKLIFSIWIAPLNSKIIFFPLIFFNEIIVTLLDQEEALVCYLLCSKVVWQILLAFHSNPFPLFPGHPARPYVLGSLAVRLGRWMGVIWNVSGSDVCHFQAKAFKSKHSPPHYLFLISS